MKKLTEISRMISNELLIIFTCNPFTQNYIKNHDFCLDTFLKSFNIRYTGFDNTRKAVWKMA